MAARKECWPCICKILEEAGASHVPGCDHLKKIIDLASNVDLDKIEDIQIDEIVTNLRT